MLSMQKVVRTGTLGSSQDHEVGCLRSVGRRGTPCPALPYLGSSQDRAGQGGPDPSGTDVRPASSPMKLRLAVPRTVSVLSGQAAVNERLAISLGKGVSDLGGPAPQASRSGGETWYKDARFAMASIGKRGGLSARVPLNRWTRVAVRGDSGVAGESRWHASPWIRRHPSQGEFGRHRSRETGKRGGA
jgi:hypothetical protein